MAFLRKFLALLLLAALLPATAHCLVEGLGIDHPCCHDVGNCAPEHDDQHSECEACAVFEGALTNVAHTSIAFTPSVLSLDTAASALLAVFAPDAPAHVRGPEDLPPRLAERLSRSVSLSV